MANLYVQILYTFVLALAYQLYEFFKSSDTEHFDPKRFIKTLIFAFIIGYGMFEYGWTYDQSLAALLANPALLVLVDKIANWIMDHVGLAAEEKIATTMTPLYKLKLSLPWTAPYRAINNLTEAIADLKARGLTRYTMSLDGRVRGTPESFLYEMKQGTALGRHKVEVFKNKPKVK
jgi:hypothetical protein